MISADRALRMVLLFSHVNTPHPLTYILEQKTCMAMRKFLCGGHAPSSFLGGISAAIFQGNVPAGS